MSEQWSDGVEVKIFLENTAISPNSDLSGKICIDIRRDSTECSKLSITYVGSETVIVAVEEEAGGGMKQHHGRADFLNITFDVAEFNNPFSHGIYEYPFICHMPNGLPPTVACNFADSECHIQYHVVAKLYGTEDQHVSSKSQFYMSSPMPIVKAGPGFIDPYCHAVTKFCGLGHGGDIIVAAAVSSILLSVEDVHTVQYAIINTSALEITSIEITVTEHVKWWTGEHTAEKTHTFFRMHQDKLDSENVLRRTASPGCKIADSEDYLRELRGILMASAASGKGSLNLCLVEGTRNSYKGELISVEHQLALHVTTSRGISIPPLTLDVYVCGSTFESNIASPALETAVSSATEATRTASKVEMSLHDYTDSVVIDRLRSFSSNIDGAINDPLSPVVSRSLTNLSIPRALSNLAEFDTLEGHLLGAFDQVNTFDQWAVTGPLHALTPSNMFSLFSAIRIPADQIEIADKLGKHMREMSCEHLAEAARGCETSCEYAIVEKLLAASGTVVDNDKIKLIEDQLGLFQLLALEKYFK